MDSIDAVIFDMDGILLDTEPLWLVSMLEVAEMYNINMTRERMRYTTGLKTNEVTTFWKEHFGWEHSITPIELSEKIIDNIIINAKSNATVMPNILQHLDFLKKNSIKIGVATSSPQRMMDELLMHFGIYHYFDTHQSAEKLKYGKPHPEVYLLACEHLNAAPQKSIAIEDSINGVISAKSARMKVLALPEKEKLNHKAFGIADKVCNKLPLPSVDFYKSFFPEL